MRSFGKVLLASLLALGFTASAQAYPSVFPTGVTINKPDKAYNGYTVIGPMRATGHGLPLIDMNGKVVHKWMNVEGQPAKVLPGGHLLANLVYYDPNNWTERKSEGFAVVELDWDGKEVWRFDKYEKRKPSAEMKVKGDLIWSANAHHDFQREGNPVGYYVPGMDYVKDGKTLIAGFKTIDGKETASLYIVDKTGKITWEWVYKDHEKECKEKGIADFQNTASWVGPNKWYDQDPVKYAAFDPENIITDDGQEVIYIIDHKTGSIVWQVGPKYAKDDPLRLMGMHLPEGGFKALPAGGMIHHAHMIPKGLPGEGNILVFNNGMPYSQVLEFDPTTKKLVWEYSATALGYGKNHSIAHSFFSGTLSSAQRLPNGNTLITEGYDGRIFEVTPELETVWEYIVPFMWYGTASGFGDAETSHRVRPTNSIYRAYRIPYDYIPQIKHDMEREVIPADPFLYDDALKNAGTVEVEEDEPSAFKRY